MPKLTDQDYRELIALTHKAMSEVQSENPIKRNELLELNSKLKKMRDHELKLSKGYGVYEIFHTNRGESSRRVFGPESEEVCYAFMNTMRKSKYAKYIVSRTP